MSLILTILVFLAVTGGLAFAGMRLYVRPKAMADRVAGVGLNAVDEQPPHPSLSFVDVVKKLGDYLPASPKDTTVIQKRMTKAGIRNPNAVKILYGAKVLLGVGLPLLVFAATSANGAGGTNQLMLMVFAGLLGFLGPNEWVNSQVKKRKYWIQKGLSNSLDLLVVCVESGLGLDQAIAQTAKELEHAFPAISEELAMVTLEMKAGKRRMEALKNLADRTGVEDLRKLVAVLVQADRFGTGIAQSLRAHSEYMRTQARQVAEEKAAKLGVKLIFPIFFCILPTLFVVTVGPIIVKIFRELIPMMNSM